MIISNIYCRISMMKRIECNVQDRISISYSASSIFTYCSGAASPIRLSTLSSISCSPSSRSASGFFTIQHPKAIPIPMNKLVNATLNNHPIRKAVIKYAIKTKNPGIRGAAA
uniref:Uncharacterized protein n=1 Tax=Corethron hystrix TaxID=216773 RepID=A0A7S1BW68_9STRA